MVDLSLFHDSLNYLSIGKEWLTPLFFVLIIMITLVQSIRLNDVEGQVTVVTKKIQRMENEGKQKVFLLETIGEKIDNLNDFVRNKTVLRKDKDI